ncbi:MAG: sulfotransferase family protein [Polyangiales bacterium]
MITRRMAARGAELHRAIPMDWTTLGDALRAAFVRRSPTLRRVQYFAGFGALFTALRSTAEVGRLVDDLVYREYRNQQVRAPVFIFANARSGTTLLHRLMSLDEESFAPYKLYQSIFPAVSLDRLFQTVKRLDELSGSPVSRLQHWIEDTFMGGWEGIHNMGLDREEEDESLFVYTMDAPGVMLLLPWIDELPRAFWLDRTEAEHRRRVMDYYEDSLKRHLFAVGGDRRFINKNAFFAGRLRSVFEKFPDGQFIYLVRHPYEVVPSVLSMFSVPWSAHSPEIRKDGPEMRALAQLAVDYYRYALEARAEIPPEQFLLLKYDELVADPRGAIEKVYDHLGLEMTDAYRRRLEEATAEQRSYQSKHAYSLEEYGLSRDFVYEQLRDIFDELGFTP